MNRPAFFIGPLGAGRGWGLFKQGRAVRIDEFPSKAEAVAAGRRLAAETDGRFIEPASVAPAWPGGSAA